MEIIYIFDLSTWQWVWVIISAFLVGFSKTGISGFMMPAIAIGAFFGMLMIKKINEKSCRYIIIGVTALAAVRLLI